MVETWLLAFAGFACLALATHRLRRDAGLRSPAIIRGLRAIGTIALVIAFAHCGTALTGERVVRFLGAAGLAGVAVVLLASVTPVARIAAWVRGMSRVRQRT